ncbi:MAG: glutamine synthetase adenylyltransferase [bacterium]
MPPKAPKEGVRLFSNQSSLTAAELHRLLAPIGFTDLTAALNCLRRIPGDEQERRVFETVLPDLLQALADAAHPDRVLVNFEKLAHAVRNPPVLFAALKDEPRLLEALAVLFAGSQFLTDILLRAPDNFRQIKEPRSLTDIKTRQQIYSEASDVVFPEQDLAQNLDRLRRFQRRELLRIGAADLLGALDFQGVVHQLSNLARVMIQICLSLVAEHLQQSVHGFAVIALGKLGGRELNYSSDVDLIFVARPPREAHKKLGQRLIWALSHATSEGFLYRIDMRLRPWGQDGSLVPGFEQNLAYLQKHAQLWEKQAMLKGRRVAGDEVMGIEFLDQVKRTLVDLPADEVRKEILKMKGKIEQKLRRKGRAWGEVKGGEGSIRDVEFITQYLQIAHARHHPEIQSRNTLDGLARLTACAILPASEYRVLAEGYVFLRTIEHHLQIMYYRQTHQLPRDPQELTFLARRLGFHGEGIGKQMVERYHQHSQAIREVFQRTFAAPSTSRVQAPRAAIQPAENSSGHLARMDSAYAFAFNQEQIRQHTEMATALTHDDPVKLVAQPLSDSDWRVTIVAFDALGELSLICGLLFDYGIDILEGSIFTYEPGGRGPQGEQRTQPMRRARRLHHRADQYDPRRKIVDVFTVRSVTDVLTAQTWARYANELSIFVKLLREKKQNEVQGEIAKRVAVAISKYSSQPGTLLPVEIAVDNTACQEYTVLRIDAPDTMGFLYEFTNALSLNGIYIARVQIRSLGDRVHDTLYVTDVQGKKITDPVKQYQLRVATVLVKHFTHLLPRSPNPQSAMLNFRAFVSHLFSQSGWTRELASLERPEVLETLSRLLGVSEFLWNDFLRMQHANLFPLVTDVKQLASPKSKKQLRQELNKQLKGTGSWGKKVEVLNLFKDREMFRVDMRYIMGVNKELCAFSHELSDLADVVIETAYDLCFSRLMETLGEPQSATGRACGVSICGLGKLGGRELGFASDIELMFIYEGPGRSAGPATITNNEFFLKLVHDMRKTIQSRHEGIFEVDLRLRPYGKAGSLVVPISLMESYYAESGAAWDYERQALVKLRPIAGDPAFAKRVTAVRDAIIYTNKPFAVSNLRAMRERQVRQLVAGGTINAKFSPGGLVDLEYLVQALQLKNGQEHPELRLTNTAEALRNLKESGILTADDTERLSEAYIFLRRLIEALRMVRGNARDLAVPKPDSDAFKFLARRLDYGENTALLFEELMQHTSVVQRIGERMLK